jgi:hypothetical protein
VERPVKDYIDEAEVTALVHLARSGDREERSGGGHSGQVVRSLSRATGHSFEVVAAALVLGDVGLLFGLPPTTVDPALPRSHGDVRVLGSGEERR